MNKVGRVFYLISKQANPKSKPIKKIDKYESINTQEEVGQNSWFGFSLIISNDANYDRKDLIDGLRSNGIEYRPIVSGNFLKNEMLLRFFDYEIFGDISGAKIIEDRGLFLGNHHYDLKNQIDLLAKVLSNIEKH